MKAVFMSGRELGSSARTGPALMGLIVMTPSIPVSEPARVWPGKKTAHMIRPGRAIEILCNRIGEFTLTASYRSIMTKPRKHRPAACTSRGLYAAKPESIKTARDIVFWHLHFDRSFVIRQLSFVVASHHPYPSPRF
jgi:hypothetical protein